MNRLRDLRKEKDVFQSEVAKYLGISTTAYSNYENETRDISTDMLLRLAKYFDVSIDYLLGTSNIRKSSSKATKVLVYGSIPAGVPLEMIEDIIDVEEISSDLTKGGKEYFGLKIKGNSMEEKYRDGDIVIFEKAETCENGQDCVVMVNGNDGTFKRVYKDNDKLILQPLNKEMYAPLVFSKEQVENLPIKVIGIAREIRRKL